MTLAIHVLKERAARCVATMIRFYFCRFAFLSAGKRFLWETLVVPHILWRRLRFRVMTNFDFSLAVQFPDTVQARIFFFGVWEPTITRYIIANLSKDDTFIDVGANIGYYSLLASRKVGNAGKVFSVEASPSTFGYFRENLSINKITNVIAINAAICAEIGEIPFYLNREEPGLSTMIPDDLQERGGSFESMVEGGPLGHFVPEVDILSAKFIKIDVEGAEWLVVRGMAALLPRLARRTEIIIEINAKSLRNYGVSVESFVGIFVENGFVPFKIDNEYAFSYYLKNTSDILLKPLIDFNFDQADVVFRRASANWATLPARAEL